MVMSTSLDIVAKLDTIVPNPGCVYSALESILDSCKTPERLEERTWLGIELSMCEFEAAGVPYPAVCSDSRSLRQCTQLLETKATWWTTFSGNYRHITAICLEYQPHFESQKVLNVFKNASILFADYHDEVGQSLRDYQTSKETSMKAWHEQATELTYELQGVLASMKDLMLMIQNSTMDVERSTSSLNALMIAAETKLNRAAVSSEQLAVQADQVSRRLESFTIVMNDVENQHLSSAALLRTTVNATMTHLEHEVNNLSAALSGLRALMGVLSVAFRLLWPILVLASVAMLLIFGRIPLRRARSASQAHPATDEVSRDLIFY